MFLFFEKLVCPISNIYVCIKKEHFHVFECPKFPQIVGFYMSRDGDANRLRISFENFEINSKTLNRGSKPLEERVELTRVYM